jgi:poly(hydroxyalkanoate) depolymerase family esterase
MRLRNLAPLAAATGLVLVIAAALTFSSPAQAATWQQVTGFGSNPGNLAMFSYRPAGLPPGAPVVVALHGCTQDAATFHANAGWRELADRWGFTVVYPQQRTANNSLACFHWFEEAHIRRGAGEAASIAQMVTHVVGSYHADPARVHVTGLSAGGAMAAVMLAAYPDLFAGGSVVAGLPYRCSPPHSTSICQYVGVNQTPQQWGDLVRAAHPGYAGARPRVAIWHGTSDFTVTAANATESVKQWTNVAGVPATPTSTEALPGNTTLDRYGDDVVRRYLVGGMGHGQPVNPGAGPQQCGATGAYFLAGICAAYHDAIWFGLDGAPGPGPSPTATATPSPEPSPSPSPSSPPVCVTADNYTHTQAGRAYHQLGYTYALGSNQNMGLWNTFATTTLRQTGPGHWVIGC